MTKKNNIEDLTDELSREIPFQEKTEVGEVFDNLDDDSTDSSRSSKIDFNARLTHTEVTNCIIIDELVGLGILPESAKITRRKKRNSVSINGLGRQEKVEIASASRSAELSGKSGGMLSNLMKPRD